MTLSITILKLAALGESGYLFINEEYIAELDLSARTDSGDVYIATGLFNGDEVDGEVTRYEDVFLWAAEPGLSTPSALSCNEPFSQISIAHHYVQRTGERATYNFSFRNNLQHWPSGNYEVSVSKDDDKSSGYCYAWDTDLKVYSQRE